MCAALSNPTPIVLSIAAHDPTGGAGMQADIESIIANGCLPVCIVTALTDQSLATGVKSIIPQNPEQLASQLNSIIEEFSIAAIKIGVVASKEILIKILNTLDNIPSVPVIFDPVVSASSGFNFCDEGLITIIQEQMIPRCKLITPNNNEAYLLVEKKEYSEIVQQFFKFGCDNILVKSVIDNLSEVVHKLNISGNEYAYSYPKLEGDYHGSGCTLSSAIAAQIALGKPIEQAVKTSLDFTWHSLHNAIIEKDNHYIPNRFFNGNV